MQYDRVVSLAEGTCIKIDNSLYASVKSITFELEKDKKYEDHISIFNERELPMSGDAYSDNNRVIIKNPAINNKFSDLNLEINTFDLNDGDAIKGVLSIISNVGVLNIPYEYKIVVSNALRTIASLENVTDYYDVIKDDYELGIAVFYDKEFVKAPFMQNEFAMNLYLGLKAGRNTNIAIIEFFKAFELDVVKFFKKADDEITRRYIDETLDKIDFDEYKHDSRLNQLLKSNYDDPNKNKINADEYEGAKALIDELQDKELLNVLASMCVRNNFIDDISFHIYLKVIEKGSNINGIYDRFLLSIPDDYSYKLPLYIYRYYFDDKSYSFDDKSKIYENIIAAFEDGEDVYMMYNQEILEFAISCMYQNKITESLVKIYNKVLNKDIINENNCNNILYLLRNHKIVVKNKSIRKIIIKYAETEKETKYDVYNGIAYVPIFFDSYIILYEDLYENRYYGEDIEIKVLFERKDLESYIIDSFPQKDIIDMTKIIKLNEKEAITKEYEVDEIRELESKIAINPVIKEKFKNKIIDFYFNEVMAGSKLIENVKIFLLKFQFSSLGLHRKRKLLKIMLESGEYRFVYEKVSNFGLEMMEDSDLSFLFSKCIDLSDSKIKSRLLNDIFAFVKKGNNDPKLCLFLTNNYEGSIENMIFVMDAMNALKLDSSFIAKKLLMVCLECNESKYIDHIFDSYDVNADNNNNLLLAYLNKKATDYILDNVPAGDKYFDKLAHYMSENYDMIETLPIIFLLAITKHISDFKILSNNEYRRILIKCMDRLLKSDYVFAYFKKLNKHIRMPYYIMNKEYIEFHADKDFVPKVTLSISGIDEKKEFELTKIFMNIYVKKVTVFKNEVINYEITNGNDPGAGVLSKGVLTYDENYEFEYPKSGKMRSTFDYINDAIVCLDRENVEGLKKVVMDMIEKQEISKELFNI